MRRRVNEPKRSLQVIGGGVPRLALRALAIDLDVMGSSTRRVDGAFGSVAAAPSPHADFANLWERGGRPVFELVDEMPFETANGTVSQTAPRCCPGRRTVLSDTDFRVVSRVELHSEEARLLSDIAEKGIRIAVLTAGEEREALQVLEASDVRASVLADVMPRGRDRRLQASARADARSASCEQGTLSQSVARAAAFAEQCELWGCRLGDAAVVASHPVDTDVMREAGIAFALTDAGYDACISADCVFSARSSGGLAAALSHLLSVLR